jgi:hypothetical protein
MVFFLSIEILALLAPSLTTKAQEIGVFPGERLTYGTSDGSPWVTESPSDAPLLYQMQKFQNLTTWNFTIVKNPDPIDFPHQIVFDQTVKLRNGTTLQRTGDALDIKSGNGSAATIFIPAGLDAGERIYPGSTNFTWTINETRTDHTHWNNRVIDILNTTAASNPANGTLTVQRTTIYWDRDTGVLLSVYEGVAGGVIGTGTVTGIEEILLYQLIANNMGIPMDYSGPTDITPIYIVIAVGAIVAVGFLVVQVARSAPKKKHKRLKETQKIKIFREFLSNMGNKFNN